MLQCVLPATTATYLDEGGFALQSTHQDLPAGIALIANVARNKLALALLDQQESHV